MALLHVDGFDHYVDSLKISSGMWTNATAAFGSATLTAGVGRNSTAGMRMVNNSGNFDNFARITKTLVPGNSTCYIHVAFTINALPAADSIAFVEAGDA